jgi:hypothetical protein
MKNVRRFYVLIGLISAIVMLGLPLGAQAYGYNGSDTDDTIYFGYCDTCYHGGPGLLICHVRDGALWLRLPVEMDTGVLTIHGCGGNDLIQAVHKGDREGCQFGNFDNLTYSAIYLVGGTGNDALIGTSGSQILDGGSGDDYLQGYPGDDELHGGSGNDFLLGDQGNDHLWGDGNDDILVGGTGDDVIDGGSGTDTFRCRSAASAIPLYDDGDAFTDCGDTTPPVSIEVTQRRDPYQEWAYMTEHRNQITCHYLTTSNPALLLSDCRIGASILMNRQIWDQDTEGISGGSEEGDQFGYALASCDFNGDNAADLAVGVPYEDVGTTISAGSVNVLYGSHAGLSAAGNQLWHQGSAGIAGGPEAGDEFGYAVAAGDFNGDGFDDLAVGVPSEEVGTTENAGLINVLYGSHAGLTATGNQLWNQGSSGISGDLEANDRFGYALDVGDFNGDGFDDLAVGVPREDVVTKGDLGLPSVSKPAKTKVVEDAGAVNILYGSRDGLTATHSQIWYQGKEGIIGSPQADNRFGWAVAAADFDGDGFDDLAVGVPFAWVGSGEYAGVVNIIYGSSNGLTSGNNQLWNQSSPGIAGDSERDDRFGFALAAGDFDGDRFADLAVGVPGESIGTTAGAGAVNIVYGSGSGLTATGDQLWNQGSPGIAGSPELNDWFGGALAAGDLNGDGYVDLAVGVKGESIGTTAGAGAVNIVYGSRDGLTGLGGPIWNQGSPGIADSPEASDQFGYAVAIGDFNGVGAGDLAVGVPLEDVSSDGNAGAVNVFYSDMPLSTTHKQYGQSCGYTALNMVMEYLGLADHSQRRYYPRDLDSPASTVGTSEWDAGRAVDVGYLLSMEHIMYEAFHKAREDDPHWNYALNSFMDSAGRLNTSDGGGQGSSFEIRYDIGHVDWNPATGTTTGKVQKWCECCPGVGFGRLSYVANKYSPDVQDARGIGITIDSGGNFGDFDHLKAVIKGFIDHGIPLVVSVENGGHYNTLIGYREDGDNFYIYTADPLDGWGRPFYNKPMRWRRILLTHDMIDAEAVDGLIIYGHAATGCSGSDSWAQEIDSRYHSDILCG